MKKLTKKLSSLAVVLTAAITNSVTNTFALDINSHETANISMLAAGNPFQSIADWFNSWSTQAKVLVPALGTFLMLVVGLVIMFAGRNWSEKAKTFAGSIIAGLAIISYGPLLITSLAV